MFKQTFTTDPKTGKQTMKITMTPANDQPELDSDDDEYDNEMEEKQMWNDFLE